MNPKETALADKLLDEAMSATPERRVVIICEYYDLLEAAAIRHGIENNLPKKTDEHLYQQ